MKDLQERLAENSIPVPGTGCWLWLGALDKGGYGRLSYRGAVDKVHRHAYKAFIGNIPTGQIVCHKCNVPSCINPAHLYAGTYLDNAKDTTHGHRWAFGTRNGNCKFSTDTKIEIIDLHLQGLSYPQINKLTNVSTSHICRIIQAWRLQ